MATDEKRKVDITKETHELFKQLKPLSKNVLIRMIIRLTIKLTETENEVKRYRERFEK